MVPPESTEARPSGDEDGQDARGAALQAPWRADAEALAHREPQVEAAAMNQQTLQDVVVFPQVRASHPAGLIEVGKRSLGEFRPSPPPASPAGAPETAAIPMDGRVRIRRVGPIAPAPASVVEHGLVQPRARAALSPARVGRVQHENT